MCRWHLDFKRFFYNPEGRVSTPVDVVVTFMHRVLRCNLGETFLWRHYVSSVSSLTLLFLFLILQRGLFRCSTKRQGLFIIHSWIVSQTHSNSRLCVSHSITLRFPLNFLWFGGERRTGCRGTVSTRSERGHRAETAVSKLFIFIFVLNSRALFHQLCTMSFNETKSISSEVNTLFFFANTLNQKWSLIFWLRKSCWFEIYQEKQAV